jgi:hypothetical protein
MIQRSVASMAAKAIDMITVQTVLAILTRPKHGGASFNINQPY